MTGFADGLRDRLRRLFQRHGSVDLKPFRRIVATATGDAEALAGWSDARLTEAAQRLRTTIGESRDTEKKQRGKRGGAKGSGFTDAQASEFCAIGREAADRTLGLRPFDVQLVGTMALLSGHVVEMATGEGKTLSGALAAAGYALQGHRVHILSINDYLARRDAEWMAPAFELLGVTVGWVAETSTPEERRAAYAADITYASVSELGFDVLRDRLCTDADELIVPTPDVVMVDEADSVLVDEAKVPLVLAGARGVGVDDQEMTKVVRRLRRGRHYEVDKDERNVSLTEAGAAEVERALGGVDIYSEEHVGSTLTRVNVALHAHALLHRDVDYLVRDGRVQLINASRGRVALLQRWPDGLQAAVEAKEGLAVSESGDVLDEITVQALIGRYPTLCGMTGTAMPAAEQLYEFYRATIAVVPPNEPCIRIDEPTRLFATRSAKEDAIVAEITARHSEGRPVLVGTQDVAESEQLAKLLEAADVPCVVLNAKNDAEEAGIIADAGAHGRVTVSTQMAGRGTDIKLGGHDGKDRERIVELGGLAVVGTGLHPSNRLDQQLRGRAGRQGDPGGSVFFASAEDELIVQHAPEAAAKLSADEAQEFTGRGAQQAFAHAQRVAEGVGLEIHRNTWRYTSLVSHQRRLISEHRDELLRTDLASRTAAEQHPKRHAELVEELGEETVEQAARLIALYHLDDRWADHLAYLADLRESIHLHALAKENPLDEFHRAAIPAFNKIRTDAADAAADTFETAEITSEGVDLDSEGLRRPSATWTYLVNDNPFGSEADRAIGALRSMALGGRRSSQRSRRSED
ncbi:accessory Sec system translocase SecA2 [Actinoalloteichus hymeniacidonis]|uniref:Protein translocase subunit SecA n=1 Tax=Actinoalloteichus hymeniacidonis TaxID=340345 RepID=A0AAC9MZF9_9PSEU|nr:accessory Sec system translocase SecA2 [Actinoalloteichus hymeniacidonis]AOS63931.1 accessory Sec system translocase SecA2, Actinobacterial type [Actinoalloteichus hymeniacidonis]MBB5908012.1 preprotein translocase subunit SecA [Actinoalloteichus hymeniacidonis]